MGMCPRRGTWAPRPQHSLEVQLPQGGEASQAGGEGPGAGGADAVPAAIGDRLPEPQLETKPSVNCSCLAPSKASVPATPVHCSSCLAPSEVRVPHASCGPAFLFRTAIGTATTEVAPACVAGD